MNTLDAMNTDILKAVQNKLSASKKVNLFLSLQLDKFETIKELVIKLKAASKTVQIVCEDETLRSKLKRKFPDIKINNTSELTSENNNSSSLDNIAPDVFLLVDERKEERLKLLFDLQTSDKTKFITIGTPAIGKKEAEELKALGYNTSTVYQKDSVRASNGNVGKALIYSPKPYLIYGLNEILDIRDIDLASPEEKKDITKKILRQKRDFEAELKEIYDRLRNGTFDLYDYKEKEFDCLGLLELIQFLQGIIHRSGIDLHTVWNQFIYVRRLRSEKYDELNSADKEIREKAEREIENFSSEKIVEITKNTITVSNYENIKAGLIESLSSEVWRKIPEEGQDFLITAVANFEMLDKYEYKQDNVDYSGVCLLFSKTMELVLRKYIFDGYKRYLNNVLSPRIGDNILEWPKSMTFKIRNGDLRPSTVFTLGAVGYIVGIVFDKYTGEFEQNSEYNDFLQYAEQLLYAGEESDFIEKQMWYIARATHKITNDYRNPAAHTGEITRTTAIECKEYMLDVQKVIKNILEKAKCR